MNLNQKPFYLNNEQIEWVEYTLQKLTTKQKVGQLFCILGDLFNENELNSLVKEYSIGGILFRPNPMNEINKKYEKLDKISVVPLIKAANLEEGGNGAISDGTRFSSQLGIAASNSLKNAERFAKVCVKEGQSVGINLTFSPVVDIDYNFMNPITNERTFGSDINKVLNNALVVTKTMQDHGLGACAKHFPGDGVDFRDQHLHPTYNSLSKDDWFNSYGKIYKSLIDEGLSTVMVGHIVQYEVSKYINPTLQFKDALPASLSKELLQGVLRNEFSFNGLIVTDATIMGGFTNALEREKAIPYCIEAGIDMIVFNTNLIEDIEYMLKGIENGILSIERLNDAVRRILAFKAKYAKKIDNKLNVSINKWQEELIDSSITLVKNLDNILPINNNKYDEIELITLGNDKCEDGTLTNYVKTLLEKEGFKISIFDIDKVDMHGPKNLNKKKLTLYLANLETESNQTVVRINWQKKHCLDMPRFVNEKDYIFVSFANPYHLVDAPRVRTYINSYCCTKNHVRITIEKLLGKSNFKGVSPIDPYCGMEDTKL